MAKVCIVCSKEVAGGHKVEDDSVIRAIRKIKRQFGVARNNELYVCEGCMEEYKKKRGKYERDLVIHAVLAAIVLIMMVVLPIFTSGFSLTAIVLGVLLAAIIMAFSLFSHWPKIADGGPAKSDGVASGKKPDAKKHIGKRKRK